MNPLLAQIISEAQEEFRNPKEEVWGNKKDYKDLMERINWKNLYQKATSLVNQQKLKPLFESVLNKKTKVVLTQDDLKKAMGFAQVSVYSANGFNYDTKRDYIFKPYYFDSIKKDDIICRLKYSDCCLSSAECLALDYILGIKNSNIRYINQFANPFKVVSKEKMSSDELPKSKQSQFKGGTTTYQTISNYSSRSRKYIAFPIIKHDSWVDYHGNNFDRVMFAVGACPNLKYFANECKKEGLKVQGEVNKIVEIN